MDKQETISFLCEIVSKVGREKYHSLLEHDCFCGKQIAVFGRDVFEHVHPEVLSFIYNAVCEKLANNAARKEVL